MARPLRELIQEYPELGEALAELENRINQLEGRIKRLEGLYEKIYHDYELLSIYIPRLTDILIRYWGASNKHRNAVLRDMSVLFNLLKELDGDMQLHYKSHTPKEIKSDAKPRRSYKYS